MQADCDDQSAVSKFLALCTVVACLIGKISSFRVSILKDFSWDWQGRFQVPAAVFDRRFFDGQNRIVSIAVCPAMPKEGLGGELWGIRAVLIHKP